MHRKFLAAFSFPTILAVVNNKLFCLAWKPSVAVL